MIAKRLSRAQSAMMREIARERGNFRGVCPTIGRLSESVHGVYRLVRRKPACHCAGFFVARSDTHGNVYRALTVRRTSETPKLNFVCI